VEQLNAKPQHRRAHVAHGLPSKKVIALSIIKSSRKRKLIRITSIKPSRSARVANPRRQLPMLIDALQRLRKVLDAN
jgi:hypothetical protein